MTVKECHVRFFYKFGRSQICLQLSPPLDPFIFEQFSRERVWVFLWTASNFGGFCPRGILPDKLFQGGFVCPNTVCDMPHFTKSWCMFSVWPTTGATTGAKKTRLGLGSVLISWCLVLRYNYKLEFEEHPHLRLWTYRNLTIRLCMATDQNIPRGNSHTNQNHPAVEDKPCVCFRWQRGYSINAYFVWDRP